MSDAKKRFISLAGDTHNSWVSELNDKSGNKVGIELGGSFCDFAWYNRYFKFR